MNPIREFKLSIEIDAPMEVVWREMVDWEGQSAWMLSTRVYEDHSSPTGVGHRLRAFTGPFARVNRFFGVMDEMVVSEWEPPRYCRVEHVGKIIRGYGTFTLSSVAGNPGRTRFDWFEEIDAPGPILFLVKPGVLVGVWISLQKFKRIVEKIRKEERGQEND